MLWLEESAPSNLINRSIDAVKEVAERLQLTHFADAKVITVAGSNGKGSTCFYAETVALAHGQTVGLYTSPHLVSFNERIRINGASISDKDLLEAFNQVYVCCQQHTISLSFFELTTLCALVCFKRYQCSLVILEVGLGGRLDATNVVANNCSVITSISLEHKQWLGDTLEAIAEEKAGIIKEKTKVVLASHLPKICLQIAKQKNATILLNEQNFTLDVETETLCFADYDTENIGIDLSVVDSQPYRLHTVKLNNLALGLVSLYAVGIKLDSSLITHSLANKSLSGRLEPFHYHGLRGWFDVAHNPESVNNLALFLSQQVNEGKYICAVFSCLEDKEVDEIVKIMIPYVRQWHIVELNDVRAMHRDKITQALEKNQVGSDQIIYHQESDFMHDLIKQPNHVNKRYIIFGSFVLIGKAKQRLSVLQ